MKTVRELIEAYLEKEDKTIVGKILELLKTEDGLFAIVARATGNFYMGAENEKPAAYLFTGRELAEEYVKGLKWSGLEAKSIEIRPEQRIAFFSDLYRSGFEAVVLDKGEGSLTMSLFSIIEKPEDEGGQVMNPTLMRAAAQFYQELARKKAIPPMQDLMCAELHKARFLAAVENMRDLNYASVTDPRGKKFIPVFTDWVEFGKFDKKRKYQGVVLRFRDLKKLLRRADGVVVNPLGFGLRLDMEKYENIEKQYGTALKVVK